MKKDTRILVTGANGQLGYDTVRELTERGYTDVRGIDVEDLDITDEAAVRHYIASYRPEVVMHNAAWTAVDKAEEMPERVYAVNALGTGYIAASCRDVGAKMLYISTDYVFPGDGDGYYEPQDEKGPLGTYGKTKSAGEDLVRELLDRWFIVRISWVFGIHGNNFVKTMLRLAETKTELSVVCDQIGSPTYTYDLSKLLCDMIETERYGIYHATNEGVCSWYEFAKYIFEVAGVTGVRVDPILTRDYQARVRQAYRPLNSRMSKDKLVESGFRRLPDWQDAVRRYITEELQIRGEVQKHE